jgi:hypothetical protein
MAMAIEPLKKEDLKRIANENHFELSDSEADAIGAMLAPIIGFLDRVDQTPIEPSPSVRRYRDRDAGQRPNLADPEPAAMALALSLGFPIERESCGAKS